MKADALSNESHQNWQTPQWLFQKLHKEYQFDIDGAASENNALLPIYLTKETNCFDTIFKGTLFINPPWNELNKDLWWEWASQNRSIMLVPFTPETKMWHKYVWPNASVFIFNKRINYVHPITKIETQGIARPSALISFNIPVKNMNDLGVWIEKI